MCIQTSKGQMDPLSDMLSVKRAAQIRLERRGPYTNPAGAP
jgi:hypothetical protein